MFGLELEVESTESKASQTADKRMDIPIPKEQNHEYLAQNKSWVGCLGEAGFGKGLKNRCIDENGGKEKAKEEI